MKKLALRLAIAIAALSASLVLPGAAFAYPPNGWDRIYYSDAAHTTAVGEEAFYCTGKSHIWWGTTSPYYDEELYSCGDPPPFTYG